MIFPPEQVADYLGITVITKRLPGLYGCTNGTDTIWLDSRLTAVEQRCVLTHEILHVVHGHTAEQPHHIEDQIHAATARWLVPWPHLLAAIGEQLTEHDLADDLGVTVEVLRYRLAHATPAERSSLTMEVANAWASAA